MNPNPLSEPVGYLMAQAEPALRGDTLSTVAPMLRAAGFVVVVHEGSHEVVGLVTQTEFLRALVEGVSLEDPVESIASPAVRIAPYVSGAEALRQFADQGIAQLVVADDDGRYVGVITPADLVPKPPERMAPKLIGGMATPFGVYLTDGISSGGASKLALIATGATLASVLLVCSILGDQAAQLAMHQGAKEGAVNAISNLVSVALFAISFQLMPLSGTHAAEHMVVHAVERGQPLTVESVRRMPRVHPRCGTNLAVAVSIFFAIAFSLEPVSWIATQLSGHIEKANDADIMIAILFTLFTWRPLGAMAQQFVTTKRPTSRQIQNGIKAADELISRSRVARRIHVSPIARLWNSGMIHVLIGSTAAGFVFYLLATWLHLPFIDVS
ncbi:MAG: DUF1385 domain-containing protein [Armatimonadetes bacterium]|nr:DUF1385 domain-containing protein [Armatimonadota bacterium]